MLFRYRMYLDDGTELGEGHYAVPIKSGETIWLNGGEQARVLALVPVEDPDSPYDGLLRVEVA